MDNLPEPLARDLVKMDHGTMRLRIESVFAPFPAWPLWMAAMLTSPCLLPPFAVLTGEAGSDALALLASPFVFFALLGLAVWQTRRQRDALELSLGMHRLEVRSSWQELSLPLAELESVSVWERSVVFKKRNGQRVSIALPERSLKTARALDELLQKAIERGRSGVGEVPAEMDALLRQGAQQAARARQDQGSL